MSQVPLVDLKAQHAEVEAEVREGFDAVFAKTAFINGPAVKDFEREFAEYSRVSHCVGVGSGTDALELAMRAVGIGPGDEAILPANTFIATALAVVRCGATPVLVDCDAATQLIDVRALEGAVTERTRAVVPVHLFGQMADMDEITSFATKHGLHVLEDAAQCQGARQNGQACGTRSTAAGTSFYPGKNLGAYGDGGAVLTDSDAVADEIRALRNYGSAVKYHHPKQGFNSRLDTLQAVVLRAKLKRLERWNSARRTAAERYDALLADAASDGRLVLPVTAPGNEHVWHLYVVRVQERDSVLSALHQAGIGAGIHYPTPIHRHGAFECLEKGPGSYPIAEILAGQILSLPLFPQITESQQQRVVDALLPALSSQTID